MLVYTYVCGDVNSYARVTNDSHEHWYPTNNDDSSVYVPIYVLMTFAGLVFWVGIPIFLHSMHIPLMFALEICYVQFPMKTLGLTDEFYYDVTNGGSAASQAKIIVHAFGCYTCSSLN